MQFDNDTFESELYLHGWTMISGSSRVSQTHCGGPEVSAAGVIKTYAEATSGIGFAVVRRSFSGTARDIGFYNPKKPGRHSLDPFGGVLSPDII